MAANSENKPFTVIFGVLVILGLAFLTFHFVGKREKHEVAVTEIAIPHDTAVVEDGVTTEATETDTDAEAVTE